MDNRLFRQKTLDRVASPDQLQDYMRVTNPGIWMVLVAVIVLLAGLIVLSSVRTLETTLSVNAQASGGVITMNLSAEEAQSVKAGMPLRVGEQEAKIGYVYQDDAGNYICTADLGVPDGSYDATIVTEAIAPIRYLLN